MNIVELYFNILDYDIVFDIAHNKRININGFKNIRKAPDIFIRRSLISIFTNKASSFKNLLKELYECHYKIYEKNNVEDFIYSVLSFPVKDSLPEHAALGMLILNFTDYAEKMVNKFEDNIKNGRHLFDGCIETPEINDGTCWNIMNKMLQLPDEIEWFKNSIGAIEKRLEIIKKIDIYRELNEKFHGISFSEFTKMFIELRKEYPDYVPITSYLCSNIENIVKSSEELREFYKKIIFYVYGCISLETLIRLEEQVEIKSMNNSSLENLKIENEKIIKKLKDELTEKESKIREILEVEEAKNEIKESENVDTVELEAASLDGGFEHILVTSYKNDRIFDAIGGCCIIHPDNVHILENMNEGFGGVVIIHRSSIPSTRELINIERLILKKNYKKIVIWASSPEEFVRNSIIKIQGLGV